MAAGLGFKDFTTGEVLTAADVDGYLMQGVWVFASATARDAAVTAPQEGNFAYLKDTNVTTYYTGSAWANLDTTGMTNPMTTTGDTIYSSSGSTPARLGIGTTGQVLTVTGGLPSWATPAAGGGAYTSLATGTLSGSTVTISSISSSYTDLYLLIKGSNLSTDSLERIRPNGATSNFMTGYIFGSTGGVNTTQEAGAGISMNMVNTALNKSGITTNTFAIYFYNYTNTSQHKVIASDFTPWNATTNAGLAGLAITRWSDTAAISSIDINVASGSFSGGTYELFGVK
jgi:hypothetical protein